MRDYGGVRGSAHSASTYTTVIPVTKAIEQPLGHLGSGLSRPECVLAHQSGLLIVPNWSGNGGISLISPTGRTHHILAKGSKPVRPNGIALENGGSVLLAHMGENQGGIYRLHANGKIDSVVTTVDGQPIPPTNFIVQDSFGRSWITVSTRLCPRALDYRSDACTGYVAVADPDCTEARIVADGLGYTNECVVDEQNGVLWINETFGRRLTRFTLHNDLSGDVQLSNKQRVHEFGAGTYPDGLALDEHGDLWVTSIISNRILKVSPCGNCQIMFEDSDAAHLERTEAAYLNGTLGREHLDKAYSAQMKNISNLAFGGADRQRLYLGNLLGDTLPYFDAPTRGVAMPHWDVDLGALQQFL